MIEPQDIRLGEHLLTKLYGHACGEVGSILLNRGRLTFTNLVRMSSLTSQSIRTALVVLIHQNCVYHSDTTIFTSPDRSTAFNQNGAEYFEAIPNEILSRIRFEKYIHIAGDLLGSESKMIIECVLENGKMRASQLVDTLASRYQGSASTHKISHLTELEQKNAAYKAHQIFRSNVLNLLGEKYLKPSHPTHSVNPHDLAMRWEKQMIAEFPGVPTPKDLKEVKERVVDKLKLAKDKDIAEMCSFDQRKRQMNGYSDRSSHKRHKPDDDILRDDMFVRVNYDRFNMKIRNSIFEQECLRSYNTEVALVIRAMLTLAESKQNDCTDLVSEPISAQSIVIKLGEQSKRLKKCFPTKCANGQFNLKLKNTGDLVAEALAITSKQDDLGTLSSSAYLAGCFDKALGQMNPLPIVSENKSNKTLGGGGGSGSGGMREFKIEYGKYSVELRKKLVTQIVREKFGVEAGRTVRVLMHKGRLDEKHLAKFAMMSLKDSRELCLKLSASNIIELQEVPKTNDRQPSRTFYLFFIDFKKLIINLSLMIRKSQTNLMIRTDEELRKKMSLLKKVNRSDVYKDQEELLNAWEKAELKKLTEVLEVLEVSKIRLERDLFILNDLPWLT